MSAPIVVPDAVARASSARFVHREQVLDVERWPGSPGLRALEAVGDLTCPRCGRRDSRVCRGAVVCRGCCYVQVLPVGAAGEALRRQVRPPRVLVNDPAEIAELYRFTVHRAVQA